MHRTLTRTATAAMILALLTGCAASGGDEAASEEAGGGTQTVDADFYLQEGELPAEPKRVVALWRTGSLLAGLGVVPVGTLEGEMRENELTPEEYEPVADVPTVGTFDGIDVEAIIELDPDLIIGMDHGGIGLDDAYAELAELYPIAILRIAEPTDVWANYETVAHLVGKQEDFATELGDLDAKLAAAAEAHPDLGELEVTSLGVQGGSIWVDTSKALTYQRIDAVGFGYNPEYTDAPERYVAELSMENIPELATQDVIFYDAELDGSISPEVQAVIDEPAFQELPAVQAGHLFPLRAATVFTLTGQNLMVDDLAAAADEVDS